MHAGAVVEDSLLSPGCRVHGVVRRSILGLNVTVETGATVTDAVVFAGVRIEAGVRVSWSIIDTDVVVGADAELGGRPRTTFPPPMSWCSSAARA